MKTTFLKCLSGIFFYLLIVSFTNAESNYSTVKVDAPFPMGPIKVFKYPKQDFPITNYGAIAGGITDNTKAIELAIDACNKAGGGRVVVPAGVWFTGPIHFKSNVNLFLKENAVLRFSDKPSDYLPAVKSSLEGMEFYNYSPLIDQKEHTITNIIQKASILYPCYRVCWLFIFFHLH